MIKKEKNIIEYIKDHFMLEPSGHDLSHLLRVYNLCSNIQKIEGGDKNVIQAAALVHDLHRVIKIKDKKYCTPEESLSKIRPILIQAQYSESQVEKILHCVKFHEEYSFSSNGKTVSDIETLILQDADNLDAIGAIGIARTFAFSGAHNVKIWDESIPIKEDDFSEEQLDPSTIHHFYNKLLRLEKNMNTKTGQKIARSRTKFMQQFLDRFFAEWKGLD